MERCCNDGRGRYDDDNDDNVDVDEECNALSGHDYGKRLCHNCFRVDVDEVEEDAMVIVMVMVESGSGSGSRYLHK